MNSIVDLLSSAPLFQNLAAHDVADLAAHCQPRQLETGEVLFISGQPCDRFYVVAAGAVRVFRTAPDGRERTLHIVRAPFTFAEAAMFGPRIFPASAAAQERSRVISVPRAPFESLISSRPQACIEMLHSMSRWLRHMLDQLENETFLNARSKLANYLMREARAAGSFHDGAIIELRLARKDIASLLGMAPETMSRATADLEERGLVRSSGRSIELLSCDGFEQLLIYDRSMA